MATVPHVTSGLGLRKFQADGFLFTRVYQINRNIIFGMVTGWQAGKLRKHGSILETEKIFLPSPKCPSWFCSLFRLLPKWVLRTLSSGVQQQVTGALPLSSADIKNDWKYASTYTETILLYRFAGATFCQSPKIMELILRYAMCSKPVFLNLCETAAQ